MFNLSGTRCFAWMLGLTFFISFGWSQSSITPIKATPKKKIAKVEPKYSKKNTHKTTKPTPKIITKVIALPRHITGLKTFSNIHYVLKAAPGVKNELRVTGRAPVVAALHYKVKKGILEFYYDNAKDHNYLKRLLHPANPDYQVKIYLSLNKPETVIQNGSSTLTMHVTGTMPLAITKSGTGFLFVKGRALNLRLLKNYGTGTVRIQTIYSNNLAVIDEGSGNVNINARKAGLTYLKIHNGHANFSLNHLQSKNLIIDADTDGIINLKGVATVSKISLAGEGSLKLYWIKSNQLTIKTYDRATLALAGVAKTVNAYAHEQSHLNLRFLRADTVYITTYHLASADIWAIKDLYALAENNSSIYYFSEPEYMSRFMRQSGSVLPMADIPGAILSFNNQHAF